MDASRPQDAIARLKPFLQNRNRAHISVWPLDIIFGGTIEYHVLPTSQQYRLRCVTVGHYSPILQHRTRRDVRRTTGKPDMDRARIAKIGQEKTNGDWGLHGQESKFLTLERMTSVFMNAPEFPSLLSVVTPTHLRLVSCRSHNIYTILIICTRTHSIHR